MESIVSHSMMISAWRVAKAPVAKNSKKKLNNLIQATNSYKFIHGSSGRFKFKEELSRWIVGYSLCHCCSPTICSLGADAVGPVPVLVARKYHVALELSHQLSKDTRANSRLVHVYLIAGVS